MNDPLKFDQGEHFEFGKNWAEYSKSISQQEIDDARSELIRLVGNSSLEGRTFLDIGCGSGLHSLAALQLGAKYIHALDIDPDSVKTTEATLAKFWPGKNYKVEKLNIFDPGFPELGQFDIVYSWGVLHHTGDMWEAIGKATARVAPQGQLIIAIYRKTPLCGFWKWEKRIFTRSGKPVRLALTNLYAGLKISKDLIRLKNPLRKIKQYNRGKRGMHWKTDLIDWLGGYPYESASAEEITDTVCKKGFSLEYSNKTLPEFGIFGSGCAEYRFRQHTTPD